MEQARVQEETQMKMDHARRLKQMRQSLEDEKRKRSEESARLRRQLELKQVNLNAWMLQTGTSWHRQCTDLPCAVSSMLLCHRQHAGSATKLRSMSMSMSLLE